MDKLAAMTVFAKVVALGGYAEAGRALGLSRSAVSKAVIELEGGLGVRLLDRTTRRVKPTEAGLVFYERCLEIIGRVEDTERDLAQLQSEPKGLLKINGPVSFGTRYLAPSLGRFMARYPDVTVELKLTDRFIDPIQEGVDVTIRIAVLADSTFVARRLASARRMLVASPAYLASHGHPHTPEDLIHHRCLNYSQLAAIQKWTLHRDGKPVDVRINSVLCADSGDALHAAALAGQGVALLPTFITGDDIRSGQLKPILPQYPPVELGIHALLPHARYLNAKSRALIDFLAAEYRSSATPHWDAGLA